MIVGVGARPGVSAGEVLAAYRAGLFPMPIRRKVLGWWSPDPRGILPLPQLRVTRSLRRSLARYEVRVDSACPAVIEACADRARPGAWIDSGSAVTSSASISASRASSRSGVADARSRSMSIAREPTRGKMIVGNRRWPA